MKKVKILYWFIIILIILYIINFLMFIYVTLYTPIFWNFPDEVYNKFIFGYYTQFVSLVFSIIPFVALFFVRKGLSITIKKGFFNQNSSKKFTVAGQLFLISGILILFWDFILLIYSRGKTPFSVISSDILLLLIGFGLLIIVDFISNGNILQQENELTI